MFVIKMKRKSISAKIKKDISIQRCVICGLSGLTQVDHIIPVAKGGTDYLENLQPLCKQCNMRKGCHKDNDYLLEYYFNNKESHIKKHAWYLSMNGRNYWDGPNPDIYKQYLSRSLNEAI